jgi:hypothetical protein
VPWVNALVVNVVAPLAKVPVPRVVEPSLNVTVPVGVAAVVSLPEGLAAPAEATTVAVKVTLAPTVDGLSDDVTEVVVAVVPPAAFTA